jgi:hypothetical protein
MKIKIISPILLYKTGFLSSINGIFNERKTGWRVLPYGTCMKIVSGEKCSGINLTEEAMKCMEKAFIPIE